MFYVFFILNLSILANIYLQIVYLTDEHIIIEARDKLNIFKKTERDNVKKCEIKADLSEVKYYLDLLDVFILKNFVSFSFSNECTGCCTKSQIQCFCI